MKKQQEFCYVAKAACGHYIGAVSADPEDFKDCTAPTLQEWREAGLLVEQKLVSFVHKGGLTFCDCQNGRQGP